jgi:thiol-disulfide isomerase/thioredoxin
MWRTYWLLAIVLALTNEIPNLTNAAIVHGIGSEIASLLLTFGVYVFAVRRACAGRIRGVLGTALLAGVDVSSLAALLTGAMVFIRSSLRLKPHSVLTGISHSGFLLLVTLLIGIFCSLVIGTVIAIARSGRSKKTAGAETAPLHSIFAGRHRASYIPFAACLVWMAFAGISFNSKKFLTSAQKTHNDGIEAMLNAGPKIGAQAPASVNMTLDGHPWRLADQRGKVVVLDFWATWCRPCIKSMPMLERIQKEYGGRGDFSMVSISIDDDRSALEEFLKTHEIHSLILYENDAGVENSMARQFEVTGVPSLWIIDKSGHIAAKHIFEEEELRFKIAKLLTE